MSIDVSLFSAFLGGLLTFLAPCTLPLIPAFLAYIGGASHGANASRAQVMWSATTFVLGFTVVFFVFGMASGALGAFLTLNKTLIAQIGGVFIMMLGFGMLGLIPLPSLSRVLGRGYGGGKSGTRTGGFLLGLLFGLGWSPCLGPILGTILILAATSSTAETGALLLLAYAVGLGLPFLLLSYWYSGALQFVTRLSPYSSIISKVGGILVIGLGVLMATGQFGVVASAGFDLYRVPLFSVLMDYM